MIKVSQVIQSKIDSVDFDNIPFGRVFTDHMFIAEYNGNEWINCEIKPLENLSLHPSNLALHYGQSIFEGMKATKHSDGSPMLMRPDMHLQRLNKSAKRMCMPQVPQELFIEAIEKLVSLEKAWIPPAKGSALYLRPFMFAKDEVLGVKPSEEYCFVILALPVGPYYAKPLRLKAETEYIRAAEGGTGAAKTAGNYAATLYPWKQAKAEGFDQIMWLDGKERKYVQEVGTMNIFFVIGDTIVTPATDKDTILKGITRNSILHILRDEGYKVEERELNIDEVMSAYEAGELKEVFGTGTAAVIISVKEVNYMGKAMTLDTSTYSVAPFAKDYIDSLRNGDKQDKFGWMQKL